MGDKVDAMHLRVRGTLRLSTRLDFALSFQAFRSENTNVDEALDEDQILCARVDWAVLAEAPPHALFSCARCG